MWQIVIEVHKGGETGTYIHIAGLSGALLYQYRQPVRLLAGTILHVFQNHSHLLDRNLSAT